MGKILIVEDDKPTQELYKVKLEASGYQVDLASDGQEAITKAGQQKPDLIILDLMLPGGMNGFDILTRLRQSDELKNTKVIVLTNLSSEAETAKDMGVYDYLVKANTSIDEVLDCVKKNIK